MAVYTEVPDEELEAFLAPYGLGRLLSYKGIAEGVENSNFMLHTDKGIFFLTLYEKRVAKSDLPFFLGLMNHLAGKGIACPVPLRNAGGEMLGELAGLAQCCGLASPARCQRRAGRRSGERPEGRTRDGARRA